MAAIPSKFHIGSKIINADTQVDVGTILHDGLYTATTTPTGTDTLLIKQGSTQKQITRDNLLYPTETVLNLTQANFTLTGGSDYALTLTSAQIEANDAIIVRITAASNSDNYTLFVPNNSKPIRIWLSRVPNTTYSANQLILYCDKAANELVKLVFDQSVSGGASNFITDENFYLTALANYGLIYENTNGKQKMLTQVYQNEI